jgi:hypothetical protein
VSEQGRLAAILVADVLDYSDAEEIAFARLRVQETNR